MLVGTAFLVVAAIPIIHTKMPLEEDMFLYWRRSEPSECKPFTTYTVNCNKCVCGADGVLYCTRMACFRKNIVEGSADVVNEVDHSSGTMPMLPIQYGKETGDTKSKITADLEDSI